MISPNKVRAYMSHISVSHTLSISVSLDLYSQL